MSFANGGHDRHDSKLCGDSLKDPKKYVFQNREDKNVDYFFVFCFWFCFGQRITESLFTHIQN